jgi:hypothetical protein
MDRRDPTFGIVGTTALARRRAGVTRIDDRGKVADN